MDVRWCRNPRRRSLPLRGRNAAEIHGKAALRQPAFGEPLADSVVELAGTDRAAEHLVIQNSRRHDNRSTELHDASARIANPTEDSQSERIEDPQGRPEQAVFRRGSIADVIGPPAAAYRQRAGL